MIGGDFHHGRSFPKRQTALVGTVWGQSGSRKIDPAWGIERAGMRGDTRSEIPAMAMRSGASPWLLRGTARRLALKAEILGRFKLRRTAEAGRHRVRIAERLIGAPWSSFVIILRRLVGDLEKLQAGEGQGATAGNLISNCGSASVVPEEKFGGHVPAFGTCLRMFATGSEARELVPCTSCACFVYPLSLASRPSLRRRVTKTQLVETC